MILAELFAGFLKVGLFAFGGAYGAIALIRDVVLSRGWMDDDMLAGMIAVSESTPGPIMVNLATYIGSTRAGLPGALAATAAVVLPSFVIIVLVSSRLDRLLKNRYIQAALRGLRPCVAGIILAAGAGMLLRQWTGNGGADPAAPVLTALLGAVYFGSRKIAERGIPPIGFIVLSAAAGVLVCGLR